MAIGRARCDSDGPLPKCGENVNATQVRVVYHTAQANYKRMDGAPKPTKVNTMSLELEATTTD